MKNTEFFTRPFLERLPPDNDEALIAVANEYHRMYTRLANAADFHHDFIEAYALLSAFIEYRELSIKMPLMTPPEIDKAGILKAINEAKSAAEGRIYHRDSRVHYASKSEEYRSLFSKTPVYEFSDDEFERIQRLISEIRTEIKNSGLIPENHKSRLFRRLEAMQAELHKKTSDIDRFWGFIAEAGIVARKFGEDLKPLNERVLELGRIVTCVIMAREGIQALPDIVKILQIK